MIYIYVNKYFMAHYKTMDSVIQYISRQNAKHIDDVATIKFGIAATPYNISWPLLILICRSLASNNTVLLSALGEAAPLEDGEDLYEMFKRYKTERLFMYAGSIRSSGETIETVFR